MARSSFIIHNSSLQPGLRADMREVSLIRVGTCVSVVVALFVVPGALAAAQKPAAKPMGLPVKAAAARMGTLASEVSAVGTLLANETVVIRPEIAGRVTAIHFNEGQTVAAGARLVT